MIISYARVSSGDQKRDRQIAALPDEGCDEIFREKAPVQSIKGRPQLERAIDRLGSQDVLIVAEWDRATRSMMECIHVLQRVAARGAAIKILDKSHLDLTAPK